MDFFQIASGEKSSGGIDLGYVVCAESLQEQNVYGIHLSILHLNISTA